MTTRDSDADDRREFLKTCGRFAAVTPPAVTLLLSTSLTSTAIARSGARDARTPGGERGRSFLDNDPPSGGGRGAASGGSGGGGGGASGGGGGGASGGGGGGASGGGGGGASGGGGGASGGRGSSANNAGSGGTGSFGGGGNQQTGGMASGCADEKEVEKEVEKEDEKRERVDCQPSDRKALRTTQLDG
jgi:hypothetical protein